MSTKEDRAEKKNISEYAFQGTHILAEYYEVDFEEKASYNRAMEALEEAIKLSEVHLIQMIGHEFPGGGYTIVAMLAESHVSIHTYPEHAAMFVDIFTCGIRNPRVIHEQLIESFEIEAFQIKTIKRGSSN